MSDYGAKHFANTGLYRRRPAIGQVSLGDLDVGEVEAKTEFMALACDMVAHYGLWTERELDLLCMA